MMNTTIRIGFPFFLGLCVVGGCSRQPSTAVSAASGAVAGQAGQGDVKGSTGGVVEMAAEYEQRCGSQEVPTRECDILRSLLVVEVAAALEEAEASRDKRATEEALAALDLDDEPAILIPACRILGRFTETPTPAAKLIPLVLESPYLEVQRLAARLLTVNPDAGAAEFGQLWINNHGDLPQAGPYEEYPDFPAHLDKMGFPEYPGAEWFSPADSDRSIGWSTKDDVDRVARWFGEKFGAPVLEPEKWAEILTQENARAMAALTDQSKLARLQQLMEKMIKGDQTVAAELEKLQQEMAKTSESAGAAMEKAVDRAANPPGSAADGARWIVAQRKDGRLSKVVLVYPLASVQRTIIQVAWDLTDYPSAWPGEKK